MIQIQTVNSHNILVQNEMEEGLVKKGMAGLWEPQLATRYYIVSQYVIRKLTPM